MAIPAPTIDATGISVATYAEYLSGLQAAYRGIYGSDVDLDADTQDGQWVAIIAAALSDHASACVACYNAFSPITAQGSGLSSVVKINGIARDVASNSLVDLLLGGTAGTVITDGYAVDTSSNKWMLPSTVTIPSAGEITVTAMAAEVGAIVAAAGTVTTIGTPTRGWQTVTNVLAATVGDPVETDAQLRIRQRKSTALPSASILAGIEGGVSALTGVTSCKVYENDTDATDANGIPSHSISVVVEGGDAASIADVIARKKGPGTGTYGTTSETISDVTSALSRVISFQRPTDVGIDVVVSLTAITGYTSVIGEQIAQSISDYLNTLTAGDDVYLTRLYTPANLYGGSESITFDVISILACRHGETPAAANVALGYAERAVGSTANVTISVV